MEDFKNNNSNFKSGFVSMLGRTNVGKSSIMNALVGEKVAARKFDTFLTTKIR